MPTPPAHSALARRRRLGSTRAPMTHRAPPQLPLLPPTPPLPPPQLGGGGTDLVRVLRQRFRLQAFRPGQEEVCRSAIDGRDCLLVMPTGGGKSLCYQLPALERSGPCLVISPLIALMEDQVAKLQQLGLNADRIHSNRSRAESQEALRAWHAGRLDFLMIAPERLRVPGFAQRLAQRPPSLIAVDEAHCISMWGHDFRPDYRLLGERLPELRGDGQIPIVAMTATATVRVQKDILAQLGIPQARAFIRGFRRDNLGIEMVERAPASRGADVLRLLSDPQRRPAIVYALSRKQVEELADDLAKHFPCAAYHAGLPPERRKEVQEGFQSGRIQVVVATVAFGMGIDKADIRTVMHLGLPSSVEAYYQEIGRAGRDGLQSKVIALYSWADRHLHTHFFERSYPPPEELVAVLKHVPEDGIRREDLLRPFRSRLEVAEAALDKLWGHSAVTIDYDDTVRDTSAAVPRWLDAYKNQRAYREAQVDDMFTLARDGGCRMVALTSYFGDVHDNRPCGHCDRCAPETDAVRRTRAPDQREQRLLQGIVDALSDTGSVSAGKLHREVFGSRLERKEFELLLDGLEREGVIASHAASFDKDGQTIRYRQIELDRETDLEDGEWVERVRLEGDEPPVRAALPKRKAAAAKATAASRAKSAAVATPPARVTEAPRRLDQGRDERLISELKAWRLAQCRLERVPAFRILTDATLLEIATVVPKTMAELLRVHGVGPRFVERYGRELLAELDR
jgi:RecQ family ATP-dependent DNA helicase